MEKIGRNSHLSKIIYKKVTLNMLLSIILIIFVPWKLKIEDMIGILG
jgi:hypothetical protein